METDRPLSQDLHFLPLARPVPDGAGKFRLPSPDQPFVRGVVATPVGEVPRVEARLARADRYGAWLARWDPGRDRADPPAAALAARTDVQCQGDGCRSGWLSGRLRAGRPVWTRPRPPVSSVPAPGDPGHGLMVRHGLYRCLHVYLAQWRAQGDVTGHPCPGRRPARRPGNLALGGIWPLSPVVYPCANGRGRRCLNCGIFRMWSAWPVSGSGVSAVGCA